MNHWATEYLEKNAAVTGIVPKMLFAGNMLANAFNPSALEMLPDIPGGRRTMVATRAVPPGQFTKMQFPDVSSISYVPAFSAPTLGLHR